MICNGDEPGNILRPQNQIHDQAWSQRSNCHSINPKLQGQCNAKRQVGNGLADYPFCNSFMFFDSPATADAVVLFEENKSAVARIANTVPDVFEY